MPAAKKKPAKPAAKGGDAAAVLKRLKQKKAENPDACIFC